MSSEQSAKNVKGLKAGPKLDGSALKIAIVTARWNDQITGALTTGCIKSLKENGVKEENIQLHTAPGSYELPFACQKLLKRDDTLDGVVAIGCLIKGETTHFEYIAGSVSAGIQQVSLQQNKPVMFGVLTCLTEEQALARAGLTETGHNHGLDWGNGVVEMALL